MSSNSRDTTRTDRREEEGYSPSSSSVILCTDQLAQLVIDPFEGLPKLGSPYFSSAFVIG
jgi:hypothetical protein